jgi:hypothetical protein
MDVLTPPTITQADELNYVAANPVALHDVVLP